MKNILKFISISSFIISLSVNTLSCQKNTNTKSNITENIINNLNKQNNKIINIQDTYNENSYYIDLNNVDAIQEILNTLNITDIEQKYISSISTMGGGNYFYFNNYSTITFQIKDSLDNNKTTAVNINLKWNDASINIQNQINVVQLQKILNDKKELIFNDDTINDDTTTINLNNAYVKNSILTNLNIPSNYFYYIKNITNDNGNKLENGKASKVLFTLNSNSNQKSLYAKMDITWNNEKANNNMLLNEMKNSILNKNLITLFGDNLANKNINESKDIILYNSEISEKQERYITLISSAINLKPDVVTPVQYDIDVYNEEYTIEKNIILYIQMPSLANSYINNLAYANNNYYINSNNNIWEYNINTNSYLDINQNSNFENPTINELNIVNNKLNVGYQNYGVGILDNNINIIEPQYYNSPSDITTLYSDKNTNELYAGSKDKGLYKLNTDNGEFINIQNITGDKEYPYITSIFNSLDGQVYCNIEYNDQLKMGGIWDMTSNTISEYSKSVGVLSNLSVYKTLNINKKLYSLTSDGIYILSSNTADKFTKLHTDNNTLDSSKVISSYYNEATNTLYVGTLNNGLWSIDLNTYSAKQLISANIKSTSKISNIYLYMGTLVVAKSTATIFNSENNNKGLWFYCIN